MIFSSQEGMTGLKLVSVHMSQGLNYQFINPIDYTQIKGYQTTEFMSHKRQCNNSIYTTLPLLLELINMRFLLFGSSRLIKKDYKSQIVSKHAD